MSSSPSAQLRQTETEYMRRSAEADERLKRAIETSVNFAVEEDLLRYWLPELVLKQQLSTDAVTVDNKWSDGWSEKNKDPLYLKVLNFKLGVGYNARVCHTRILRRPYIEVSWAPVKSGSS